MTILIVHNFYQQFGGEDGVFNTEAELLRSYGHQVVVVTRHNDSIRQIRRPMLAGATIWNSASYHELRETMRQHRPDVVHFHNTFPLISPSAYYAARVEGVPVVQTLHNFRLLCPNALFFRAGRICEDCMGKTVPWPGVVHKCYRDNRSASMVVAAMLVIHRALRTWRREVDAYIALSPASRQKLIEGGLPAEKIFIKPNFLTPEPTVGKGEGGYAIYVGRLSEEKGLPTLLNAWKLINRDFPLKIVGDGPLAPLVQDASRQNPSIQWLGSRPSPQVYELIGKAAFLTLCSECYENCPRTIVEAYAKGTPVIASRLGAMADLVRHGQTGLLFGPHDSLDLARQVQALLADPATLALMRTAAREEFITKYTAAGNYRQLQAIYAQAMAMRHPQRRVCQLQT